MYSLAHSALAAVLAIFYKTPTRRERTLPTNTFMSQSLLLPHRSKASDPSGVSLDGTAVTHGVEPDGSVAPKYSPQAMAENVDDGANNSVLPPTPTKRNTPSKQMMEMVLKAPPPPPPSNPPPKKKRPTPTSPVERKSTEALKTMEATKKMADIVQKRLDAARAIYESPDLKLDDEAEIPAIPSDKSTTSQKSATSPSLSKSKECASPPTKLDTSRCEAALTGASSTKSSSSASKPRPTTKTAAVKPPVRNSSLSESKSTTSSQTSPKKKRKGFFRKVFGRKKDARADDASMTTATTKNRNLPVAANNDVRQAESSDTLSYQPEVFFAPDDVSTLSAPSFQSKQKTTEATEARRSREPKGSSLERVVEEPSALSVRSSKDSPVSAKTDALNNRSMRDPSPRGAAIPFEMDPSPRNNSLSVPDADSLLIVEDAELSTAGYDEKKEDEAASPATKLSPTAASSPKDIVVPPPPPPPSTTRFDSDTGLPIPASPQSEVTAPASNMMLAAVHVNAMATKAFYKSNDPKPAPVLSKSAPPHATTIPEGGMIDKTPFEAPTPPRANKKPEPLNPSFIGIMKIKPKNTRDDHKMRVEVVQLGFSIMRMKRNRAVASSQVKRVVPVPNSKKTEKDSTYFGPYEEPEPKDPIQRAGRRLLSKAAVPIQSMVRRYLAQCEAIDRMWALIEIQCYFRRWRAEANLIAHQTAAIKIQRAFRAVKFRGAAVQIQRIVRGYLVAAQTFDTVYSIILIQARARGNAVREDVRALRNASASTIQTAWRGFAARMDYQFAIVDIIIAQNVARRWFAARRAKVLRAERRQASAVKIQAAWRGFQGYTDFIFVMIDVIIIQRTVRRHQARKRVAELRVQTAATKIQRNWRRYKDQSKMLFDLMHIIIVQSVARRRMVLKRMEREQAAALKIQAAWRGFWCFSHYIIMQYEATRLQAVIRGNKVRRIHSVKLGSAIAIQAAVRGFAAKTRYDRLKYQHVVVMGRVEGLREKNSAKHIQFWWRIVLECRREKAAALVIERFFISVKREVEKEIRRVERKHLKKLQKGHRSKRIVGPEEKLLEKAWSSTVDSDILSPSSRSQNQKSSTIGVTAAEKYLKMYGIKSSPSRSNRDQYRFSDGKEMLPKGRASASSKGASSTRNGTITTISPRSRISEKLSRIRVKDTYRDINAVVSRQYADDEKSV